MSDEQIKGSCFCGAVEFEVNGEPTVMVYCHCKDCQAWSACLLYTSPSPRDLSTSRMPSSA